MPLRRPVHVFASRAPRFLVLMLLLGGFWPNSAPAGPAVFAVPGDPLIVTPQSWWHVEAGAPLSVQEAEALYAAGTFQAGSREWLELGIMHGTVWLAIPIRNDSPTEDLVLEARNPRLSYLDLYVPDGAGGFRVIQSGSARPIDVRPIRYPMPAYPFTLASGTETTLFLRVENLGDMRVRLWLWDATAFQNNMSVAYYPEMLSIGILLALALSHFLVFLSLREKAYLYLTLFILSWLLFFMAGTGIGNMLIWSHVQWLALRANTVFLILMCTTFILFSMDFLESPRRMPRLHQLGQVFVLVWLLHFCVVGLTESVYRIYINQFLGLATLVYVAVLAIRGVVQGNRSARLFIASWVFMLCGTALMLLLSLYLIHVQLVLGTSMISVLFTISILLWSFELTGRVKARAREQRRLLEAQVAERTADLERALREVKTLSGLLPICSCCKKIRDDKGYWSSVEHYLIQHTSALFTHGICPDCCVTLYPEFSEQQAARGQSDREAS